MTERSTDRLSPAQGTWGHVLRGPTTAYPDVVRGPATACVVAAYGPEAYPVAARGPFGIEVPA